ncbi:peptidase M20 [Granulicella tundricola MP5ACTX9]|uniref:Peptidase M20 n=2 Tax=Granulicella TaxID=940557 RepID=E8WYA9_GRATM|nr:peptidase M20 [Granulicella tundricola MP5ACTX9]
MTGSGTALAQHRIARLASQRLVHRAFHWLHLHQPQLRMWQMAMLAIPAPPFGEEARALWFLERFRELGLGNVHLDEEGNALGELGGGERRPTLSDEAAEGGAHGSFILVSAHLDTVFPAGTDTTPTEDGARILGPGSCDNAAGLSGMLGLIAALKFAGIEPEVPILFAANVGEEGEGDLRGMHHLFERGEYSGRIRAAVALEGSGTATAVDRGLGSRRFRVTVTGPGGHSWTDAGAPNPILLLARGLVELADRVSGAGAEARTTLSAGQIGGGTSINSIPETASVLLDLRSTDPFELQRHELEIHRTFELIVGRSGGGAKLAIEVIGSRPAAALAADAGILQTLKAVDRHLGLRTEMRLGSTDANVPLAMGIPALAMAAGGTGGGIHTLAEWYDPTGRETALRRLLLVILDLVGVGGG